MSSATAVMVASTLVLLHGAAIAQKPITVSHSKTARVDTTRADSVRADTTRARKARADTTLVMSRAVNTVIARTDTVVVRLDAARTDSARVQIVSNANDTTGVGRVDTMVAVTARTAILTDTAALVQVDTAGSETAVTAVARVDTAVVTRADNTTLDSARMGPSVPETDSAAGSTDVARSGPLVVATPDAVRSSFVGKRSKSSEPTFTQKHLSNDRVLSAKVEKRFELKKLFRDRGMTFPADEVLLRIFKRERALEVWVRTNGQPEFSLLKSYRICALGTLVGPKRERGDGQTPEGFYYIDTFNPSSGFHLSLRVDYPNRADRIRSQGRELGGDIYIHGGCKTLGCLAVTDDGIKELYWLAVEARNAGQRIAVHIFPTKLTDDALHQLVTTFDSRPDLQRFWTNLKPGYDYFETNHRLPAISIDDQGLYRVKSTESTAAPVAEPTHAKLKN